MKRIVIIGFLAALIVPLPLFAQLADTAWPMFHRDVEHTGRSPFPGSISGELVWSYETGSYVSSSLSIGADGILSVGLPDDVIYYFQDPTPTETPTIMPTPPATPIPETGSGVPPTREPPGTSSWERCQVCRRAPSTT